MASVVREYQAMSFLTKDDIILKNKTKPIIVVNYCRLRVEVTANRTDLLH